MLVKTSVLAGVVGVVGDIVFGLTVVERILGSSTIPKVGG